MLRTAFYILCSTLLLRAEAFTFLVKRELTSTSALDSIFWSKVELSGTCEPGNEIRAKIDIPSTVAVDLTGISIFFANDLKAILRLDFEEKVKGTYYTTPYRVEKKMEGTKEVERSKTDSVTVIGTFDSSWLPPNCTKVSASIRTQNKLYNYYGIQNSDISIEDLQVVEEYKDFRCTLL